MVNILRSIGLFLAFIRYLVNSASLGNILSVALGFGCIVNTLFCATIRPQNNGGYIAIGHSGINFKSALLAKPSGLNSIGSRAKYSTYGLFTGGILSPETLLNS